MNRICSVEDCSSAYFSKGFCRKHLERWKRHGDPNKVLKILSPKGATLAWLKQNANYEGEECLIWPFARHPDGRAHMNRGKPTRIMCEMVHGPAPTPSHAAAHSCGNGFGACINPQHLRWATPKENEADKVIHGTVVIGEKHYNAKLTEEIVKEIRSLRRIITRKEIAERYGVKKNAIDKVLDGKSWRHVL